MKIFLSLMSILSAEFFTAQCNWSLAINPAQVYTTAPGSQTATVFLAITGPTANLRYLVSEYPATSAVIPTNATIWTGTYSTSGISTQTLFIFGYGQYRYVITNTITNCQNNGIFCVGWCPFIMDFSATAPTCSNCCDGSILINPPQGFTSYSVSCSSGTVTGNPPTSINGLCYGIYTVCLTNTQLPDQVCKTFTINSTTYVKEIPLQNEFYIYPNPTNELIRIECTSFKEAEKILSAEVLNSLGQSVKKTELRLDDKIAAIEIKELPPGVYHLRLLGKQSLVICKKFVVAR